MNSALSLELAGVSSAAVAAKAPLLAVERIENPARFSALRDEWTELLGASASRRLFLTWEWLHTWWKHLPEDQHLHLITVHNGSELIAIAPLVLRPSRLRRLLPFSALEFLGTGSVGSDYLDIVIRSGSEQAALAALAKYLSEQQHVLELSRVESTTAQANVLARELGQHGWVATTATTDTCPVIDLSSHTWDTYLASLGSAHRYNWRRRLRNLEKQWRVRFDQVQTEEQRAEAMRTLIALHQQRWRQRGCPGAFHTPGLVAFHEELSRLALQLGWLRLYVLRLDDKPVAAMYGFHYNGTLYFYQSGFDPDLAKHSVGLVLMGLAIRNAIAEGAKAFDFLRGDEPYKFLWASEQRRLIRIELFPPSLRGRLCRQAMELRWGIKRLYSLATTVADPGLL